MYIMHLPLSLNECSKCWQNFIRDFNNKWEQLTHKDTTKEDAFRCHFDDANTELKTMWKARLNGDMWENISGVQFDSEQDAMIFAMRWS